MISAAPAPVIPDTPVKVVTFVPEPALEPDRVTVVATVSPEKSIVASSAPPVYVPTVPPSKVNASKPAPPSIVATLPGELTWNVSIPAPPLSVRALATLTLNASVAVPPCRTSTVPKDSVVVPSLYVDVLPIVHVLATSRPVNVSAPSCPFTLNVVMPDALPREINSTVSFPAPALISKSALGLLNVIDSPAVESTVICPTPASLTVIVSPVLP